MYYRNQRALHAEFSHCRQNWYYGLRHSSMAVKWGFRAHLDPTLAEREGSRPQDPHRIDATVIDWLIEYMCIIMLVQMSCWGWRYDWKVHLTLSTSLFLSTSKYRTQLWSFRNRPTLSPTRYRIESLHTYRLHSMIGNWHHPVVRLITVYNLTSVYNYVGTDEYDVISETYEDEWRRRSSATAEKQRVSCPHG